MPQARPSVAAPAPREAAIRVLIVDDSAVARAVLAKMIGARPEFALVGQASGAAGALAVLETASVDIILLDLQMPGMDGLAALPALLARGRGARVLIVSSACAEGAVSTMAALRLGAADTLLKPGASAFLGGFADALIERMLRIARPAAAAPVAARATPSRIGAAPLECIAIGSSTGGVVALGAFFAALPDAVRVPILVTQHLPAPFMPFFAPQLAEMARRPVRLAAPGLAPTPGEVLLAPGDAHLTLVRTAAHVRVRLERVRAASGCLPSVDPMLASLARVYGAGATAVMLSGMGRDGADGARTMVAAGGTLYAQDAATSVVWGMPGVVAEAGLAKAVLPPHAIAARIAAAQAEERAPWR